MSQIEALPGLSIGNSNPALATTDPEWIERSAVLAILRAVVLTLCFEPGCTLPGHTSRVYEASHLPETPE